MDFAKEKSFMNYVKSIISPDVEPERIKLLQKASKAADDTVGENSFYVDNFVRSETPIQMCIRDRCLIDAVSRKIEGTLGKIESADDDSFSNGLIEYPHYTKPREYRGLAVPEVLLNGNHKEIKEFRFQQSLERTKNKRPDLYEKFMKKNS